MLAAQAANIDMAIGADFAKADKRIAADFEQKFGREPAMSVDASERFVIRSPQVRQVLLPPQLPPQGNWSRIISCFPEPTPPKRSRPLELYGRVRRSRTRQRYLVAFHAPEDILAEVPAKQWTSYDWTLPPAGKVTGTFGHCHRLSGNTVGKRLVFAAVDRTGFLQADGQT